MLLARFEDPAADADDWQRARHTLSITNEPRAMERLCSVALDPMQPTAVRERAASLVTDEAWLNATRDQVRTWWHGADPVASRIALGFMDADDADLLVPVAADPSHPLYVEALDAMRFGFDAPQFQAVKAAAFASADPGTVEIAASLALYDEPARAEPMLIAATQNPCTAVANEAVSALEYYPTRQTLRYLIELRRQESGRDRLDASLLGRAIGWNLHQFGSALRDHATELNEWMRPVADLVVASEPDEPILPRPLPPRSRPGPLRPLVDALADPDGPWAKRLDWLRSIGWVCDSRDWTTVPEPDRRYVTARLRHHPDPEVRSSLCPLLVEWHDANTLLEMAWDSTWRVQRSAVYALGRLPADAALARELKLILDDRTQYRKHGETLAAWTQHVAGARAIDRLIPMAADGAELYGMRTSAIWNLADLAKREASDDRCRHRVRTAIATLLHCLDEPPAVDWSIHTTLLNACRQCQVPTKRHGRWLAAVDNLDARVAWAECSGNT